VSQSTLSQLLSKLAGISPMPSDAALLEDTEGLADQYDALIEEIGQHLSEEPPSPAEETEVVRVLADSFGPDGGLGTNWGTLHLLERCTPSVAMPIIQDRALHGPPGSRVWCTFILGRRRNSDDLPLFLALVHDDVPEVQIQAISSLFMLSQTVPLCPVAVRQAPDRRSRLQPTGITQRDSSDRP
jgi:hypothetical protein